MKGKILKKTIALPGASERKRAFVAPTQSLSLVKINVAGRLPLQLNFPVSIGSVMVNMFGRVGAQSAANENNCGFAKITIPVAAKFELSQLGRRWSAL